MSPLAPWEKLPRSDLNGESEENPNSCGKTCNFTTGSNFSQQMHIEIAFRAIERGQPGDSMETINCSDIEKLPCDALSIINEMHIEKIPWIDVVDGHGIQQSLAAACIPLITTLTPPTGKKACSGYSRQPVAGALELWKRGSWSAELEHAKG